MKRNFKKIFCDKTLEENCANNFEEIKFEFTSTGTTQQNGVVERGFAKLYSRMHAMMAHVGLHENLKSGLWPKCAATSTKLEKLWSTHTKKNTHMRSSTEKFQTKQNT